MLANWVDRYKARHSPSNPRLWDDANRSSDCIDAGSPIIDDGSGLSLHALKAGCVVTLASHVTRPFSQHPCFYWLQVLLSGSQEFLLLHGGYIPVSHYHWNFHVDSRYMGWKEKYCGSASTTYKQPFRANNTSCLHRERYQTIRDTTKPSTAKCNKDIYTLFLLAESKYSGCTRLAKF